MTDTLRERLGAAPPPSVAALSEEARADLAAVLVEARRAQATALAAAFYATLKHVPFPVRGVVKKVLLG